MKFALLVLFALRATPAFAQLVPGTPYVRTTQAITYAPCANATVLDTDIDDGGFDVNLPFSFMYYDDLETSVSIDANGAIAFPSGTSISYTNQTPGSTFTPDGFIGPLWDDLRLYASNNGLLGWEVAGTAPNRTFTVCYENYSRLSASGFTFDAQVRLFEGSAGRIEIDYGAINGTASLSATMGMEDQAGARPIFFHPSNCTTACTQTELAALANTRITLIQDPGVDIAAARVTVPELAFLGAQTAIDVTLSNVNSADVGPFTVELFAGDGPNVANPVSVGTAQVTLPGFATQTLTISAVMPPALGERSVYIAAVADSAGAVTEVDENNNRTVSTESIRLVQGSADLAVESVAITATAAIDAGGMTTVFTTVRNAGGEAATNVPVAVMLSTNPVISPQDAELFRFNITLAPNQIRTSTDTVTVPGSTNSGIYYLGAFADPDQTLDELSESNNGRADPDPIVVRGGQLAIATPDLPDAYLGEAYSALMTAVGGDGTYLWTIVQGNLPNGLGLVSATGEIFGRPTLAETQSFTLQVDSGGESAERAFTLTVNDPEEPLTVVTRDLAGGVVGQEYVFRLIATGGTVTSSLSWTAAGLPDGLALAGDTIAGTPIAAGDANVTVMVSNGVESAMRVLSLTVRENANLLIVPMVLEPARFGQPYDAQLFATGGVPPIAWTLELNQLPAGVELGVDGRLFGTPMEVGTFRFAVEARDSAPDMLIATDVNSFELVVEDVPGFEVVADALPDAIVGESYEVTLTASGGLMPYDWTVGGNPLPDGLSPSANPATGELRIVGTPTEAGVSNLLIEVVDSQQRRAVRALAIRVIDPIVEGEEEGGCGCSTTGPRASWIGLLVLSACAAILRTTRARSDRTRAAFSAGRSPQP